MEKKTALDFQELMEKTWILTCEDWMNIFKDWIGSQKDIDSGILIKIPMDAGYVTFSSLSDKFEMYSHMSVIIPKVQTTRALTTEHSKLFNNV